MKRRDLKAELKNQKADQLNEMLIDRKKKLFLAKNSRFTSENYSLQKVRELKYSVAVISTIIREISKEA